MLGSQSAHCWLTNDSTVFRRARLGSARLGLARLGLARLGLAWLGLAGRDSRATHSATLAMTAAWQGAKTVETLWDEQRCWLEEKRQLTGESVGLA